MKKNVCTFLIYLPAIISSFSCKQEPTKTQASQENSKESLIKYAQGFEIERYETYTILKVSNAFPDSDKTFNYALVPEKSQQSKKSSEDDALNELLLNNEIDAMVQIPLKSVVVTSTTHIPSLDMLGVTETLSGFPNLDYISSTLSRKRISQGLIKELGQNESINTEVTIDLNPDAVISFGVEGENKALESVQRAGIPVLYNGDWVEKNPLGKAEWIKFFGALYAKQKLADSLFTVIETNYLEAKKLASKVSDRPSVLGGAMYKDVWYLPQGDSWQANLIVDAGGNYLWAETQGFGSIALSVESVLNKAQNANVWIAPGQFTSYTDLITSNPVYEQFNAFKNKNIFTFSAKKGETGGVIYYELAPNRPDLVLQDLIFSMHPELLPEYSPYFFTPLEE